MASNFPRWRGDSTTPFVFHLAQDLQELGWKITVLAPHAPGAATEETMDGVDIKRFRYLWPEHLETVCYHGGMLVNLRKNPLDYIKILPFLAMEVFSLFRELLSQKYALINTHCLLPQGFAGAVANLSCHLPHITTIHGSDIFALRKPLFLACKRFALKHVDAVTVNSSVAETAARELSRDTPAILRRIPMGVAQIEGSHDSMAAMLRNRYRRGNGPLIIFVGRLVEEKGVSDLLTAISLLTSQFPDITAIIIGEGHDRLTFDAQAEELGIATHVSFPGWVEPLDLPAWYQSADVFVGPSKRSPEGWIEAQGLTFIEALMAGTPVVATRSGGIVDAIRHEETGLLVEENSPSEIAAAVERIHNDHDLRQRLIANGKALAESTFSRHASAAAFSSLFDELLERRCPTP